MESRFCQIQPIPWLLYGCCCQSVAELKNPFMRFENAMMIDDYKIRLVVSLFFSWLIAPENFKIISWFLGLEAKLMTTPLVGIFHQKYIFAYQGSCSTK